MFMLLSLINENHKKIEFLAIPFMINAGVCRGCYLIFKVKKK